MIKKISITFFFIIILFVAFLIYLSIYGIETTKFNSLIKNEIKSYNNKLDIKLKSVKLLLDLKKLSINIKSLDPVIIYNDKNIDLKQLSTIFSIDSYIKINYGFKNLNISTKDTNIKDLIGIGKSIENSTQLLVISQIIKKGTLQTNIDLRFDENGQIKSDYKINGSAKDIELKLLKNQIIKNIDFDFNIKEKNYKFNNISFNYNKIKFLSDSILLKSNKDIYLIEGNLKNNEANLNSDILSIFFNNNLNNIELKNTKFQTINKFYIKLSKKFKIKDYKVKSELNLNEIKYNFKSKLVKKYIKNYKDFINIKNTILNIEYSKNNIAINGSSNYLINEFNEKLEFKIAKLKDSYDFDINISLDKAEIDIKNINYKKLEDKKSSLNLVGKYNKDKNLFFKTINFKENKNKIELKGLKLKFNKGYKINEFKNITLNYLTDQGINNDIKIINKNKNYFINGSVFDGTSMLKDLTESKTKINIFENFDDLNSLIKVKIDKVYLNKENFVNNLEGDCKISKNKIVDSNLISKFSKKEKLYFSIKSTNNNETVTTLYSDRATPFVKNYKFIKGFEEGVLDFQSIKKNNKSKSVLKIDNFKVKEVPILAKLLTLASLQGIADLLTGEGIRFTDFEMIYSNKDNLITIDEIYAIGPAISMMMSGYIDDEKLVSLRGTLVPATTINRTIASIPLIGDILIGKKVGEGVFGVSFKIKGPPKDLKTSVNPIKTLTPRFITRTLEKIKKQD